MAVHIIRFAITLIVGPWNKAKICETIYNLISLMKAQHVRLSFSNFNSLHAVMLRDSSVAILNC